MLFDCKITVDTSGASDFAFSIWQIFRWSFVTFYASRNGLILSFNLWKVRPTFQQSQRHTYWCTTTLCWREGRISLWIAVRQKFSRCKNNARFNSLVTLVDSSLGLLFKIQQNFANPRELQVNKHFCHPSFGLRLKSAIFLDMVIWITLFGYPLFIIIH